MAPSPFLDIDEVVSTLERHLKQLKDLRTQARSWSSQPVSTATTTVDVRSRLATAARSIIVDAQTVLRSLDLPHSLQDLDANSIAYLALPRRSARAPLVRERATQEAQPIAAPVYGARQKPKKPRVQSTQKYSNTDKETNDDETSDETNDEANDEDTETPHGQHKYTKTNDAASRDHDDPGNATTPQETDQPDVYPVPTAPDGICQPTDLGSYTVPTLEKFIYHDNVQRTGMCHLCVSDFSFKAFDLDLSCVQDANSTTTELKCNKSTYSRPGVMTISSDNSPPPNESCPNFNNTPRIEYSNRQLEQIFESYCTPSTSSRPHWYLIGSTEEVFGERYRNLDLLTPGPYMRQSLDGAIIEGVNTTYIYASYSQGQTATAMHYEDCQWGSVNLMLGGAAKLWLSVEPAYTKRLEDQLRVLFPDMTTCSQRVRHIGALFSPSFLKSLGVRYNIKACYPGELIFTTLATYHQVINMGANIAAAVNFVDSKTPTYPKDYIFCSSSTCRSANSITAKHFRTAKRPSPEEMTSERSKRNRQSVTTVELSKLQELTLGLGEYLFTELVPKSPAAVLASILSKQAVIRLVRLLSAQKMPLYNELESLTAHKNSSTFTRYAAAYHCVARKSIENVDLCLLRARVNEHAYAHLLEQKKGDAERLDTKEVTKILMEQKIQDTLSTRRTFRHEFSTCKKWLSLCKILGPGLLALLPLQSEPPYCLSTRTFTRMTDTNITEFNNLVTEFMKVPKHRETLERLCAIANGLVRRIIQDTHFQFGLTEASRNKANFEYDCEWVDGAICPPPGIEDFVLEATLVSLKPRPYLIQSELAKEQYRASQRSAIDPTLIPRASVGCSQGTETCMCLQAHRLDLCRISTHPSGISIRSCVVFSAGHLIGELTGLLHETEHKDCSGTFCALSWPEQSRDSPIHLHWDNSGNWVRRVRHSCNPCAEFAVQVIGCRLRVILKAKTAIATNSEITADWRILPGQLESKLQQCVQCEAPCSSLVPDIGSNDGGGTP
jgi:hypothetical protein